MPILLMLTEMKTSMSLYRIPSSAVAVVLILDACRSGSDSDPVADTDDQIAGSDTTRVR